MQLGSHYKVLSSLLGFQYTREPIGVTRTWAIVHKPRSTLLNVTSTVPMTIFVANLCTCWLTSRRHLSLIFFSCAMQLGTYCAVLSLLLGFEYTRKPTGVTPTCAFFTNRGQPFLLSQAQYLWLMLVVNLCWTLETTWHSASSFALYNLAHRIQNCPRP